MKKIIKFVLFFVCFISASAIAQSNEQTVIPAEGGKYVSCGHDHDGQPGCMVFVPDEPAIDPNIQASPAGPTGACTPRPYRQLVAYDDQLLVNYTHEQIVALIMKGHKQFADALDSSGITNQVGTRVVGIIPVTIPSYTKLSEVFTWIKDPIDGKLDQLFLIKNDSLDADHLLILSKEGISASDKGVNLGMTVLPGGSLSDFQSILWNKNCGVINFITFVPNLTTTFAHESGHGIGAGHESNNLGLPPYANAYVNSTKQVNDLMKGARVESWTYNRFSGPNSKIVKNGETIVMCEDTAVHNAAKHITECLDRIWCATENHVTRVSIQPTTCGSGILQANTNNADTFTWKVISGTCSLGATTGQSVSYMASTLSTIQVIGWKQGKWYADTALIEIPALQRTAQPMSECVGTTIMINGLPYVVSKDTTMEYMTIDSLSGCEMVVDVIIKALQTSASSQQATIKSGQTYTLPDGKVVNVTGTYTSKLTNQWGCDSTITTVLTVTTATVDPKVLGISIYPNPATDYLTIQGMRAEDEVSLQDIVGRKIHISLHENKISLCNLPSGIYVLCLQRGGNSVVWKVLKL